MTQIAREYMEKMNVCDTQYILVRHTDREHPHCHLVYNRVDNRGKAIPDGNDRYRSRKSGVQGTDAEIRPVFFPPSVKSA
ncbi:MAG: relaxase/mobilization nuclease domain-containing protein [Alistipes indistinctus]